MFPSIYSDIRQIAVGSKARIVPSDRLGQRQIAVAASFGPVLMDNHPAIAGSNTNAKAEEQKIQERRKFGLYRHCMRDAIFGIKARI